MSKMMMLVTALSVASAGCAAAQSNLATGSRFVALGTAGAAQDRSVGSPGSSWLQFRNVDQDQRSLCGQNLVSLCTK